MFNFALSSETQSAINDRRHSTGRVGRESRDQETRPQKRITSKVVITSLSLWPSHSFIVSYRGETTHPMAVSHWVILIQAKIFHPRSPEVFFCKRNTSTCKSDLQFAPPFLCFCTILRLGRQNFTNAAKTRRKRETRWVLKKARWKSKKRDKSR